MARPATSFGNAGGSPNIVSGNLTGIQIQGAGATGNVVQRNYVGTDLNGAVDLGNQASGLGIATGASNNTVGGTAAGAGNVISGNDNHGIEISSSTSTGNVIQGNYVGTNAAGTSELPNGQALGGSSGRGIKINGAPANTIGGTAAGRNVISGNIKYGIEIVDAGASGNIVRSNYIGTDATGTSPVGNREAGMYVDERAEYYHRRYHNGSSERDQRQRAGVSTGRRAGHRYHRRSRERALRSRAT